jgi:hypothetical protein
MIVDTLHELFSGIDDPGLLRACAALAEICLVPTTATRCGVACVVLWTLGLFGRVVAAIDTLETTVGAAPISLLLMRMAARFRTAERGGEIERGAQVHVLRERIQNEPPEVRGRLLLGLAYVCYLADGFHGDEGGERRRRLDESVGYAETALEFMMDDPLGAAFAINHCAYVGTLADPESSRTAEYVDRLLRLRATFAWHYRFADTLARVYTAKARRLLEDASRTSEIEKRQHLKRVADANFAIAAEVIATAWPQFADPEVMELEMVIVHLRLQCL